MPLVIQEVDLHFLPFLWRQDLFRRATTPEFGVRNSAAKIKLAIRGAPVSLRAAKEGSLFVGCFEVNGKFEI